MIIQKVSLRNFVSHQDASVDFPLGVTVIVGQNGAGKTSILDAVTYSLFREHGRGVDANLIRRGQASSKVSVVFSVRGKNYEVEWTLSAGKPSTGNLRDLNSGYPLVKPGSGEKTIIPEIAKLVGVDSKVFMNAIYVKQGQLAQLIEERPAERKKIIGYLLGIDELEKLWEALKEPINTLRTRINYCETELKRTLTVENLLSQKRQELETKKEQLWEIELQRQEVAKQLSAVRQELEVLRELKRTDEELTRKIITLTGQLQSLKKEFESINEKIADLAKACQDIESVEAEYHAHIAHQSELKELTGELKSVEEEIASKKPFLTELEQKKLEKQHLEGLIHVFLEDFRRRTGVQATVETVENKWTTLFDRVRAELVTRQQKLDKLSAGKNRYTALSAATLTSIPLASLLLAFLLQNPAPLLLNIVPIAIQYWLIRRRKKIEQQLQEVSVEAAELMNVLRELERMNPAELGQYKAKIEAVDSRLRELAERAGNIQKLEQKRDEIQNKIREKNLLLEELKPKHDQYIKASAILEKHGIENKGQAKSIIQKMSEQAATLEAEIQRTGEKLRLLEKEKQKTGFDNRKLEEGEQLYEKLREQEKKVEGAYGATMEAVKNLEETVKTLEEELEKLRSLQREYDKLSYYVSSLERIRDVFHKDGLLQKIIRKQASVSVEQVARLFLQQFELRFDDIRLDEDFNVTVYGPNGEQSLDTLSGGEKIVVAIVLRLAIAASLAGEKLESIIMDEPTTHLDTERRRELVNVLKNFAGGKRIIPQVIVVSHDRELIEAADTVYEVSISEKGSRITVTEDTAAL